jgi:hypothetical protein
MGGVSRVRAASMLLGHGVILVVGLVALALTLVSCFDSPIERRAPSP